MKKLLERSEERIKLFFWAYRKAKDDAEDFSYTVNLDNLTQDELCEIHCRINCHKWDMRIGEPPKRYDSKFGFCFSCAVMDRIADKIGDKPIAKWWNVHYQQIMSEQEFEDWYDKKVQKAALR